MVIVAGYPAEMQDFLKANAGLASRFHFTLTFASYTPDEIVAIGRHLAGRERLVVDDAAWELLRAEATQLRSMPYQSGTMLDVAGNGRYARKVTVACRRERARRLHRLAPSPRTSNNSCGTSRPCSRSASRTCSARLLNRGQLQKRETGPASRPPPKTAAPTAAQPSYCKRKVGRFDPAWTSGYLLGSGR